MEIQFIHRRERKLYSQSTTPTSDVTRFITFSMEKELEKSLTELSNVPGVQGIICADKQGLCVSSRGRVPPSAAGVIATVSKLANQLEPTSSPPKIILESDGLNVLIQSQKGITTAIYKSSAKQS